MARFLLVLDSLGSGGAQRQLVSIAKGLANRGHDVEFCIYYPQLDHFASSLQQANIKVHKLQKRLRFDPSIVYQLHKLLKQGNFDGAMAFMLTPSLYLELAVVFLPKKYRPAIGFSDRITFDKEFKPSWFFSIRQQLHRVCDFITTNSHHHKDKLATLFPWMQDKLNTVYNGVDQSILKGSEIRPYAGQYLLTVARVIDYKNFERLAQAMVKCQQAHGEVPTVLWLGKIFDPAGVDRVKLLLEQAGIPDKLLFLGECKDVASYYQHADALLHPSLIEGFSNAVAEAICYGLPLLLGNISDHERILTRYQNGLLFDVESVDSIADSLHRFTQLNDTDRQQMGDNSKLAAQALFVMDAAVAAYEQLLLGKQADIKQVTKQQ